MSRTHAQRLQYWEDLLTKVEDSLIAGVPVIAHTLDGQVISREPTEEWILAIEARIASMRRLTSGGLVASRNVMRRMPRA